MRFFSHFQYHFLQGGASLADMSQVSVFFILLGIAAFYIGLSLAIVLYIVGHRLRREQ